ncbi:hypothetical protein GCM10010302_26480 [Streptomyces polychromogenes]|uniref:Uncharacterized protein n=1 Tax=Streptomyces polychromogenes TaxID=67342 RepID=A0ABN0VCH4_9ACTN
MSETVRIKPLAEAIGGGANVPDLRRRNHELAVQRYRNAAARINPSGWGHTAVEGSGLFAEVAAEETPHRVYSDVS